MVFCNFLCYKKVNSSFDSRSAFFNFLRNKGKDKIVFLGSCRLLFQNFDTREKIAKLVALVIIFGCLKLLLEKLVGCLWWISVNVLPDTLGFKLCFPLIINFKTWKTFICRSGHSKVFLGKGVLKICSKFRGEHPYWSGISIKLKHLYWNHTLAWCSPVELLHIFRTPFLQKTSGRLFLYMVDIQSIHSSYQRFRICKLIFIVSYTRSKLLFLQDFIKFSSILQ